MDLISDLVMLQGFTYFVFVAVIVFVAVVVAFSIREKMLLLKL